MSNGNWTRRDIIKASAAAVALPSLVPGEALGLAGATPASDTYCLGLCLYHALTGKKYLAGKTVADTVALSAQPPPFEGASLKRLQASPWASSWLL